MKLLGDYHIHSKASKFFHAKNSIEEIVNAANSVGLKEIAITDHGYKHMCGINKEKLINARLAINEINESSKVKVLLGLEANIISEDGTIDVDNETLSMIDILAVGFHRMIKNDLTCFFGKPKKTPEAIEKYTNAYINCINKYPVTYISHIDSILTTDLYKIGLACKEKGVMIEINNRHTKWTDEQVEALKKSDCLFIVNSDAHRREEVGRVKNCFEIIKKYDIPSDSIANVEFDIKERSVKDVEFDAFYRIYSDKIKQKQEKDNEIKEKKIYEFTETLSPEMESALQEIAKERGITYVKKEEIPEPKLDLDLLLDDDKALLQLAEDYIKIKSENIEETQGTETEDAVEVVSELESEKTKIEEPEIKSKKLAKSKKLEKKAEDKTKTKKEIKKTSK